METNTLTDIPLVTSIDDISAISATLVGYIGIGIMLYGCILGVADFLWCTMKHQNRLPQIRIHLGKHLALGLEFLVAKDIIETIVQPSWDELGKLGAIILIRTVVTFILSWELKEVKDEIVEERAIKAALAE